MIVIRHTQKQSLKLLGKEQLKYMKTRLIVRPLIIPRKIIDIDIITGHMIIGWATIIQKDIIGIHITLQDIIPDIIIQSEIIITAGDIN